MHFKSEGIQRVENGNFNGFGIMYLYQEWWDERVTMVQFLTSI
jgi:hypothetical protein